jgi:hypothetical protein
MSVFLIAVMAGCAPQSGELVLPAAETGSPNDSPALAGATTDVAASAAATPAEAGTEGGEMGSEAMGQAVTESSDPVTSSDSSQAGVVVAVTPLSEAEQAAQPPGQTEPGVEESAGPDQTDPGTTQTQPPAGWLMYISDAYGFSVMYPSNFVVGSPNAEVLQGLIPPPSAAVYFMDPNTAASALAGTDAPDLEVRIFESGPVASLDQWLASSGAVVPGDGKTTAPYQGSFVSGLEVCESTMLAPGCSLFIAGQNRVYQLRYLTQPGEAMAASFNLTGQ